MFFCNILEYLYGYFFNCILWKFNMFGVGGGGYLKIDHIAPIVERIFFSKYKKNLKHFDNSIKYHTYNITLIRTQNKFQGPGSVLNSYSRIRILPRWPPEQLTCSVKDFAKHVTMSQNT